MIRLAALLVLASLPLARAETKTPETQIDLPDSALVDQDGLPVRLRTDVIGDRLVVVNFVFTTCTTICPALSSILAGLQKPLRKRLASDARLVTISIDPEHDTPKRLHDYAEKLGAGPSWRWLTGTPAEVKRTLQAMGVWTSAVEDHAPLVLVGDGRTGRWLRLNGFPNQPQILAAIATLEAARKETSRAEAKARAWFTDTALVGRDGAPVRFYTDVLRGRTVVIHFLFTNCLDACPLLTRKLVEVKQQLGKAFGRDVRFVAISVDPERDTPAELDAFARRNNAAVEGWQFFTGTPKAIREVTTRLGQYVSDPAEHSTGFIAGNEATRHWMKVRPDQPVEAIVEQLRALASERPAVPGRR